MVSHYTHIRFLCRFIIDYVFQINQSGQRTFSLKAHVKLFKNTPPTQFHRSYEYGWMSRVVQPNFYEYLIQLSCTLFLSYGSCQIHLRKWPKNCHSEEIRALKSFISSQMDFIVCFVYYTTESIILLLGKKITISNTHFWWLLNEIMFLWQ